MNKKNALFALTAALSLLTISALAQETAPSMPAKDTMTKPDKMTKPDTMQTDTMKTGDMKTGDMMHGDMMEQGYQPYTKAAYDKAMSMQRVLFFHATWCPNCKAADADIMKNIAMLPKNTVIFKVDYDKETALKKKYGITMQHSFVLVDAKGKALKRWAGGGMKEIAMNTSKGM